MSTFTAFSHLSYFLLTVMCFYVCWERFTYYLTYPTGSTVSQEGLLSQDIPLIAICPQPSLNTTALNKLSSGSVGPADFCTNGACNFLDIFGNLVESKNFNTSQVETLYEALRLTAPEVVLSAYAKLLNGSFVKLTRETYNLPLNELGDCPVFTVPDGLRDVMSIV